MIEDGKVHPLTCLTSLTESEKHHLLDKKIVLCKHIQTEHLLKEYGVRPDKIPRVLEEARQLCGA
jgi:DNA-directed RNA polymerase subunit H (RpoH/RPB5)